MNRFRDVSGHPAAGAPDVWEPIVFRAGEIDVEIDRLCSAAPPANGRRASLFTHPRAPESSPSLAPGIRVALNALLPGEETAPIRHNSTQVGFALRGCARVDGGARAHDVEVFDVWNTPSWRWYSLRNAAAEPFVWLSYSNAPLLERLEVHLAEDAADREGGDLARQPPDDRLDTDADERRRSPYGILELGDGAMLMPYETLISPPSLPSPSLHWPWSAVKQRLDQLEALGDSYVGRRLYLMYNPLTGRTNGTTPSFFATITIRPPGIVDRPHRHVSAAINYFFHGTGWSRVGGHRYEWGPGDLMLTAPGWMIHHHASDPGDRVYELTVQDQPMHIATESLLWQEDLEQPARVLGSESGFDTNRPLAGRP
jgi:gentisate 1,2-dioxygenase